METVDNFTPTGPINYDEKNGTIIVSTKNGNDLSIFMIGDEVQYFNPAGFNLTKGIPDVKFLENGNVAVLGANNNSSVTFTIFKMEGTNATQLFTLELDNCINKTCGESPNNFTQPFSLSEDEAGNVLASARIADHQKNDYQLLWKLINNNKTGDYDLIFKESGKSLANLVLHYIPGNDLFYDFSLGRDQQPITIVTDKDPHNNTLVRSYDLLNSEECIPVNKSDAGKSQCFLEDGDDGCHVGGGDNNNEIICRPGSGSDSIADNVSYRSGDNNNATIVETFFNQTRIVPTLSKISNGITSFIDSAVIYILNATNLVAYQLELGDPVGIVIDPVNGFVSVYNALNKTQQIIFNGASNVSSCIGNMTGIQDLFNSTIFRNCSEADQFTTITSTITSTMPTTAGNSTLTTNIPTAATTVTALLTTIFSSMVTTLGNFTTGSSQQPTESIYTTPSQPTTGLNSTDSIMSGSSFNYDYLGFLSLGVLPIIGLLGRCVYRKMKSYKEGRVRNPDSNIQSVVHDKSEKKDEDGKDYNKYIIPRVNNSSSSNTHYYDKLIDPGQEGRERAEAETRRLAEQYLPNQTQQPYNPFASLKPLEDIVNRKPVPKKIPTSKIPRPKIINQGSGSNAAPEHTPLAPLSVEEQESYRAIRTAQWVVAATRATGAVSGFGSDYENPDALSTGGGAYNQEQRYPYDQERYLRKYHSNVRSEAELTTNNRGSRYVTVPGPVANPSSFEGQYKRPPEIDNALNRSHLPAPVTPPSLSSNSSVERLDAGRRSEQHRYRPA